MVGTDSRKGGAWRCTVCGQAGHRIDSCPLPGAKELQNLRAQLKKGGGEVASASPSAAGQGADGNPKWRASYRRWQRTAKRASAEGQGADGDSAQAPAAGRRRRRAEAARPAPAEGSLAERLEKLRERLREAEGKLAASEARLRAIDMALGRPGSPGQEAKAAAPPASVPAAPPAPAATPLSKRTGRRRAASPERARLPGADGATEAGPGALSAPGCGGGDASALASGANTTPPKRTRKRSQDQVAATLHDPVSAPPVRKRGRPKKVPLVDPSCGV